MIHHRGLSFLGTMTLLATISVMIFAAVASADMIVELGSVLNGTAPTETGSPWLTAEFRAAEQPGKVTLILSSHLANPSEFISRVAFNVAPAIDPASIAITQTGGSPIEKIVAGEHDAQDIPGAGTLGKGFDLLFQWSTSSNEMRLDGTDVATFALYACGLTPEDFNYANASRSAEIAAKIQGLSGNTSGVVKESRTMHVEPVPEPATFVLFAAAGTWLALAGLLRYLKR